MQFIDLKAQYAQLQERIDSRIQAVLNHGQYIMGPEVGELEAQLAAYLGVEHAISCANGTDALQLALMALGVGPGDVVFCSNFTFFASAEVIALVGATPVFVDVDANTFNMSPEHLEYCIERVGAELDLQPKSVIAVDLFGLPADLPAIRAITQRHGLSLIEDAAQSFGSRIGERAVGAYADIATTSFFPAKPLGCYGDGGALFSNDAALAERLRSLRIHGKGQGKYDNVRIGMNSRLDTLQAAVLLEKLQVYPAELAARQALAATYSEHLGAQLDCPQPADGFHSVWAQYTVRSGERDALRQWLAQRDIPSMVYYQRGMHQQGAFASPAIDIDYPVSEQLGAEVLSLPFHPYLSAGDRDAVVEQVQAFFTPQ